MTGHGHSSKQFSRCHPRSRESYSSRGSHDTYSQETQVMGREDEMTPLSIAATIHDYVSLVHLIYTFSVIYCTSQLSIDAKPPTRYPFTVPLPPPPPPSVPPFSLPSFLPLCLQSLMQADQVSICGNMHKERQWRGASQAASPPLSLRWRYVR